jgi:hypothetical protein
MPGPKLSAQFHTFGIVTSTNENPLITLFLKTLFETRHHGVLRRELETGTHSIFEYLVCCFCLRCAALISQCVRDGFGSKQGVWSAKFFESAGGAFRRSLPLCLLTLDW